MAFLDSVGITVANLDDAVSFFSRVFRSEELERASVGRDDPFYLRDLVGAPEQTSLEVSYLRVPHSNTILELQEYQGIRQRTVQAAPTDIGAFHLGFYVDSVEESLDRLGLPSMGRVSPIPYGPCVGGKTAYLHGPEGVNIQLMGITRRPGGVPILANADFWIDHVGMVVDSIDTTVAFFGSLLDMPLLHRAEWRGENADYVADTLGFAHGLELDAAHMMLPYDLTMLEFIEYSGCPQKRLNTTPTDIGAVHIGLAVDSLDELVRRMAPPMVGRVVHLPTGPWGDSRSAAVRTADGVLLRLSETTRRPGDLPRMRPSAGIAVPATASA